MKNWLIVFKDKILKLREKIFSRESLCLIWVLECPPPLITLHLALPLMVGDRRNDYCCYCSGRLPFVERVIRSCARVPITTDLKSESRARRLTDRRVLDFSQCIDRTIKKKYWNRYHTTVIHLDDAKLGVCGRLTTIRSSIIRKRNRKCKRRAFKILESTTKDVRHVSNRSYWNDVDFVFTQFVRYNHTFPRGNVIVSYALGPCRAGWNHACLRDIHVQ